MIVSVCMVGGSTAVALMPEGGGKSAGGDGGGTSRGGSPGGPGGPGGQCQGPSLSSMSICIVDMSPNDGSAAMPAMSGILTTRCSPNDV